jgi:hypothetical protein
MRALVIAALAVWLGAITPSVGIPARFAAAQEERRDQLERDQVVFDLAVMSTMEVRGLADIRYWHCGHKHGRGRVSLTCALNPLAKGCP